MTRFQDIDIYAFGNEILLAGAIYSTGERNYALFFPESQPQARLPVEPVDMDLQDWQALLLQTDQLNVQLARELQPLQHRMLRLLAAGGACLI